MYVDDKFIHWLQRNSTQTIARPLSFRGTFHIWTIFYTFWVTSSQKIANELDHTVEMLMTHRVAPGGLFFSESKLATVFSYEISIFSAKWFAQLKNLMLDSIFTKNAILILSCWVLHPIKSCHFQLHWQKES